MPRWETPRFFVDQTSLGVGRALATVRGDVVYPGHKRLPSVPEDTLDPVWMPIVAGMGLVVISRDRHIATKPAELAAFRDHGLRAFWVGGKKDLGNWENLVRLVRAWDKIEGIIEVRGQGPWFYSINQDSIREIVIRPPRPLRSSSPPTARVDPSSPKQLRLRL